ncbi:UNVERIFIED_CONTAM: Zn-dependent oligopeptidase [Paenibacillus sp. PvR008]
MKINKKYNYWELYCEIDDDTSSTRQCIGSIWSDEWSGLELFEMTDEQLKEQLIDDIEYYPEKVDKRKIKSAIKELREIYEEVKIMG